MDRVQRLVRRYRRGYVAVQDQLVLNRTAATSLLSHDAGIRATAAPSSMWMERRREVED